MVISTVMTYTSRKSTFEQVLCIYYLVQFRQKNNEDKNKDVKVLVDTGSEVNAIHPIYAMKLGLRVGKINIGAQKINRFYLDTFEIVIADFLVKHKLETVWFFYGTYLLANISLEVALGIYLLTFSKVDVLFVEQKFVWKTYTVT